MQFTERHPLSVHAKASVSYAWHGDTEKAYDHVMYIVTHHNKILTIGKAYVLTNLSLARLSHGSAPVRKPLPLRATN